MTEKATYAATNAPENKEDFKAFFLELLEEDAAFYHSIKKKLVVKAEKKKKKPLEPLPPALPFSEMPYWKLNPDFKPLDATPYAIKKETIIKLQELWEDAPPIEELIEQLNA